MNAILNLLKSFKNLSHLKLVSNFVLVSEELEVNWKTDVFKDKLN